MSSVGEGIQIGDAGKFAIFMMKQSLDEATRALAEGDVIAILRAYEDLKDITG